MKLHSQYNITAKTNLGICVKDLALLDKHGMTVMKKDKNTSSLEPTGDLFFILFYFQYLIYFSDLVDILNIHCVPQNSGKQWQNIT